jgi:hypothetical protein
VWTRRATRSQKWAFVLGLVMYLPSPFYLLAISDIAATRDSHSSKVAAMLICAVAVMLFVELPTIGMFVRPETVTSRINRFHSWLVRNGWTLASGAAFYGRVRHIPARGFIITDRLRYLAWLLAFLAGMFLYTIQSALLKTASNWVEWALAPFWVVGLIAFLAWTPVFLLHKRISFRDALSGALLGAAGWVGLRILSGLLFTNWLNWYSKYCGGLGIVMALFFWLLTATLILIVAAALSPAYAVRRQTRASAPGNPPAAADQAAGKAEE